MIRYKIDFRCPQKQEKTESKKQEKGSKLNFQQKKKPCSFTYYSTVVVVFIALTTATA
jgi:hypothetical protein